jgi:hypothetical protein
VNVQYGINGWSVSFMRVCELYVLCNLILSFCVFVEYVMLR